MSETIDVLLWCAALATWLMMFFAMVGQGVKKLLRLVRGRPGKLRQAPPDRHQNAGR
ncbi:hypothetical protein NLM31_15500 [Bradyrhizobium sp. CCGUVB4N]|uniref:hypothetical protein n=1 Tax=unclassified Bradyrhizobium TaxID=2631580 RepID=UPI0020B2D397|nr:MULTISPECIES: hypothetical protein [unclassified Bradyrhizobium]MCP3381755.1 hypothetical protein [Bradyrhizobium sp. CCGUVB4N]WFU78644.1 hypothetical protein QA645_29490 [Bradyrhizobium sp. CIAT3101]